MDEISKEDTLTQNLNSITLLQKKKRVNANRSSLMTKSQIVDSNLNNDTIKTNTSNDENSSEKSPQKQTEKSEKVELKPSVALDEYKKMCSKSYGTPNLNIVSQLKQDTLSIYSNSLNQKEILSLSKILSKFIYFKVINFGPFDPLKGKNQNQNKKSTESKPLSAPKNTKKKNPKKNKYIIPLNLVQAIGKNLSISDQLISLKINNFIFQADLIPQLTKGLLDNNSLLELSIVKCVIPIDAFDLILGGLLKHKKIEKINLSKNKLNDKYGSMISRVISRQNERRDEIVWGYGLRNEVPKTNEYARGLVSLDLSHNEFSNISAESISNCLVIDQYIRYIDLSNNKLNYHSMKCFYNMLKTNKTLLTINLKGNPGYNDKIHEHLVMKMCKNIKNLYELFLNKKYTLEDYEYYKGFIDKKFFIYSYDDMNNEYNTSIGFNGNNSKMSGRIMRGDTNTNNFDNINESGYRQTSPNRSKTNPKKTNKSFTINNNNSNNCNSICNASPFDSHSKRTKNDVKYEDLELKNMKLTSENITLKKKLAEIKAKYIQKNIEDKINENSNSESLTVPKENYEKILNLLGEVDNLVKNTEKKIGSKEKKKTFKSNTYLKKKSTIKSNNSSYYKTMDNAINKKYEEIKKIVDNVELEENQNKKKKRQMKNKLYNKEYNISVDENDNIERNSSNENDKINGEYESKDFNNISKYKEKTTDNINDSGNQKFTNNKVEEEKNDLVVYKKNNDTHYHKNAKINNKEKKDKKNNNNYLLKSTKINNKEKKDNKNNTNKIIDKEKKENNEIVGINHNNIEHLDNEVDKPNKITDNKNEETTKNNEENIEKKSKENTFKVKNVDGNEDDKKQIFNFEELDAEPSEEINESDEIQKKAVNQLFNNNDEDNYDDYSENDANEYQYSHEQNDNNGDNYSENEGMYEMDNNIVHKNF